ncbi:MAG: hypothetical protein K9I59_10905 [Chlorobium sp.]|nr:hypothetical protein [Chlorobium sp.]MCF8272173.1 hypothetical protein [Chlorobium sp.]MCF8288541.1 hypothetical protein [Chlorobium sp.]MCF8292135.1 hypothetical protein [Chlorobium sp.]MCF8386213.1 hypothetical protein [Chlorobium sp.]
MNETEYPVSIFRMNAGKPSVRFRKPSLDATFPVRPVSLLLAALPLRFRYTTDY